MNRILNSVAEHTIYLHENHKKEKLCQHFDIHCLIQSEYFINRKNKYVYNQIVNFFRRVTSNIEL